MTITLTDDDSGDDVTIVTIEVANVDPVLGLDHVGSITFLGGEAFIGRVGVGQSHDADGSDVSSDDLTFAWTFLPDLTAASNTHFNNGVPAEPLTPSPNVNPIAVIDTASVTLATAGVYTVAVTLTDDDDGTASDSLTKIVTDVCDCTKSPRASGRPRSRSPSKARPTAGILRTRRCRRISTSSTSPAVISTSKLC